MEEQLVADNGSAHAAAKLVADKRRLLVSIEKVPRIQRIVADEIKDFAIEGVAARLAHGIEHAAHGAPVLGAEGAGLYLELARTAGAVHDVVRSGRRIVLVVGQIRAVEQEDVVV